MAEHNGRIELERTVDSIVVGIRHRKDLGDLGALMTSIERRGLLQPITITPDGVLVCGRRRLEAVKRLGWRTLRVWVRSGISDDLSRLLAQQDENELHKPLTPLEEAALFEELSKVLAEDAARRQEESRFGGMSGGGDSPPPGGASIGGAAESPTPSVKGKTRENASRLVTGKDSSQRLERINAIGRASTDQRLPPPVRQIATRELGRINDGADVAPAFGRVKAAIELAGGKLRLETPTPQELESLTEDGVERAQRERRGRDPRPVTRNDGAHLSVRAFMLTWGDLDGWSRFYDPTAIAIQLKPGDWEMFERVLAETLAFADEVRGLRSTPASA